MESKSTVEPKFVLRSNKAYTKRSGRRWKQVGLSNAEAYDPFQTPKLIRPKPQMTPEQRAAELAKLEARKRLQADLKREQLKSKALAKLKEAERIKKQKLLAAERLRVQERIKSFQKAGVEMFVADGKNNVAKIAGKTVREGDVLDGVLVVKIKDNGAVVLTPAPIQ